MTIWQPSQPMLMLIGCTASGKGAVAFELARRTGGRILSIDSMKVYRRMDIGTGKPSAERRREIPHYLVDVVEPSESFSLGRYVELADAAITEMAAESQGPIIAAGGTAMYIRGILEGIFDGPGADEQLRERLKEEASAIGLTELYKRLQSADPATADRLHPNDAKRIIRALEVFELTGEPISAFQNQFKSGDFRYPWRVFGLRREKQDASGRINRRIKRMIESGLVQEVESLLAEPQGLSEQAAQAVGYAEIIATQEGRLPLEKAVEQIKINTRRLAKSQRTWFRSFERVTWLDLAEDDTVESVVDRIITEMGW